MKILLESNENYMENNLTCGMDGSTSKSGNDGCVDGFVCSNVVAY